MSKKKRRFQNGLAYSTDPDLEVDSYEEEVDTPPPEEQILRIRLDTKHRRGKTVTLIDGFIGAQEDLKNLGKELKTFCGTGGSAKEGEIIIQGDVREKVKEYLQKEGYRIGKR